MAKGRENNQKTARIRQVGLATEQPDLAINLVMQLSSAPENIVPAVIEQWVANQRADQALAWIQTLAPGAVRDHASAAFSQAAVVSDPAVAEQVVNDIQNPELRLSIIDANINRLKNSNPEEAIAWTLRHLDEGKRLSGLLDISKAWTFINKSSAESYILSSPVLTEQDRSAMLEVVRKGGK